MNPRTLKISYSVAIVLLLAPLAWLSQPASGDPRSGNVSPGGKLARLRTEYRMSQASLGEIDPASETLKLATLGMRGVAANLLWGRANDYKTKENWAGLSAVLEQITKLQPNFVEVWRFQSWNLAYNISAEWDDYHDRYTWVIRGVEFLEQGSRYNIDEPRLLWYQGWISAQKIGRADEHVQFRRLFREDDEFHAPREPNRDTMTAEEKERLKELRDNWLVGKEVFLAAQSAVDNKGANLRNMNPIVFHSDPAMSQINYAEALENDDRLVRYADFRIGEREMTAEERRVREPEQAANETYRVNQAQAAWERAAREWFGNESFSFGAREHPTSSGITIRMNDMELAVREQQRLAAEMEALQPGLRAQLRQNKIAELPENQQTALAMEPSARNADEAMAAFEAETKVFITHAEWAAAVDEAQRETAQRLATDAQNWDDKRSLIERDRQQVNFAYWRDRCKMEGDSLTLQARLLMDKANVAHYFDADLEAARRYYEESLAVWVQIRDKYPGIIADSIVGIELGENVGRYESVLKQLDEALPQDHPFYAMYQELKQRQQPDLGPPQ